MVSYVLNNYKWDVGTITWHINTSDSPTPITNYESYISDASTKATIASAIDYWQHFIGVKFQQVSATSNADLSFGYADAWNEWNVEALTILAGSVGSDGTSTMQHNIAVILQDPSYGQHYSGTQTFKSIVMHELGHVLGLDHNYDAASIMDAANHEKIDFADIAGVQSLYGANPDNSDVFVQDMTTGDKAYVEGDNFNGPSELPLDKQLIIGSTDEFISSEMISHNINMTTKGDKAYFLHGGSGNDAEDVSASTGKYNTLDGGTGSNFLTGNSGATDIMYNDFRGSGAQDTWSTERGIGAGDEIISWGLNKNNWGNTWYDNLGADGYKGLTAIAWNHNGHNDTFTLTGYSTADLSNGRLSVSYGQTSDSDYMLIRVNS